VLEAKRELADRYKKFCDQHHIDFITEPDGAISNYWLNSILLKDRQERDAFLQMAYDQGIHCRPAWELMHHLPMFARCDHGDLSNAESIAERLVNLPSTPIL